MSSLGQLARDVESELDARSKLHDVHTHMTDVLKHDKIFSALSADRNSQGHAAGRASELVEGLVRFHLAAALFKNPALPLPSARAQGELLMHACTLRPQ